MLISEHYKNQRLTAMIYSFTYMALGNVKAAHTTIQNFLTNHPNDSDMRLAYANTLDNDELRLQHINRVYEQHNLVPLARLDNTRPLSMDNLTAHAPQIDSPLKVSVIIPAFNSADKISIAIESLLAQSWKNLEIIVVDDCSPDETYTIAKQYSKRDSRIIALRQEKNAGAYVARNAGLAIATGDFITTHDGDDWSHPQKIEKQMEFLSNNPKVMGVCTFWIRSLNSLHFTQNWRLNPYLTHWSHSSFLFRRQVVEDLGGWDSVIVGGDTEYIWRVEAKYGNWAVKNIMGTVPMAIALDDDASLTRSKATHVKTIHYGLRHIYRSNAKYWHRKSANLNISNSTNRPFPAPLSMEIRNAPALTLNMLLIGDFSCAEHCETAKELISNNPENIIGLLHWPLFKKIEEELSDIYFSLLKNIYIKAIVYGQEVVCKKVIILDEKLLEFIPEQLPKITPENGIILSKKNDNCTKEKFYYLFNKEAELRIP